MLHEITSATTKHLFHIVGLGLIGLYVPANWSPMLWAKMQASVMLHHAVTYPEVLHVRAIA